MNFHAKVLCNYVEIVHTNQGRTYQIFYFNLLLHGFQDGFVISFRKKEMYLYSSLENILRLFEVMKMVFKKCIRIVKGTTNLSSTMVANFVIRRLYRYVYLVFPIMVLKE